MSDSVDVGMGMVDPASLAPWSHNPRRIAPAAVAAVARSIDRFGFGAPLVVRPSDRRILAGHVRQRAALSLGLAAVPVRWLELDDEAASALALADNRLGELVPWDDAALASLLAACSPEDVTVAGWDAASLAGVAMAAGGNDDPSHMDHLARLSSRAPTVELVVRCTPDELRRLSAWLLDQSLAGAQGGEAMCSALRV
jgi:hypothetical protein